MEALAQLLTSLIDYLINFITELLTGGSPISLLIVVTLIVLILGKIKGNDQY